jgi:dynactin complex subunit
MIELTLDDESTTLRNHLVSLRTAEIKVKRLIDSAKTIEERTQYEEDLKDIKGELKALKIKIAREKIGGKTK